MKMTGGKVFLKNTLLPKQKIISLKGGECMAKKKKAKKKAGKKRAAPKRKKKGGKKKR